MGRLQGVVTGDIGLAKADCSPGPFPGPAMNDDPMAITRQLLVCAGDALLKRQASCVGPSTGPCGAALRPRFLPVSAPEPVSLRQW